MLILELDTYSFSF